MAVTERAAAFDEKAENTLCYIHRPAAKSRPRDPALTDVQKIRDDHEVSFGPYRIFPSLCLLMREGHKIELGRKAFSVLLTLVQAGGETVTKDELLSRVWPSDVVEENNLQAQISALRAALGADRHLISTEFNRGYRLAMASRTTTTSPRGAASSVLSGADHPAQLAPLVGRDRELNTLSRALSSHRLVTITGAGGIGKSRLALELYRQTGPAFPGGVTLIELAQLTGPGLVRPTIAAKFNHEFDANEPADVDRNVSSKRRQLLIVDNCEHLLEETSRAISEILQTSPETCVLTTTQEPLGIEGEEVFRLQPLELPPAETNSLESLLHYPAAELLRQRIQASDKETPLGDEEAADLCTVCRRLDGIPLAIELAAVRISQIGLRAVVVGLSDRFRLLTAGRRTSMPRHQTLRATLDWSFNLLSEPERTLLQRLGIFSGSFTLDAVHEIALPEAVDVWAVADLLGGLATKSMVVKATEGTRTRFRLTETVRSFVLEKLAPTGEFPNSAARHAAYYQARLAVAAGEWGRLPSRRWVAEFAGDLPDVRAALDWGLSTKQDPKAAITALCASLPFWTQLSLLDECRLRVGQVLSEFPEALAADRSLEMELNAALGASTIWSRGPLPEARAAWTRTLEIATDLNQIEPRMRARYGLWLHALRAGRYEESLGWADALRNDGETLGDRTAIEAGRRTAGVSQHFLGHHVEAARLISAAVSLDVPIQDGHSPLRFGLDQRAAGLAFLGRVQWLQGDFDQSIRTCAIAVQEADRLEHATTLCCALLEGSCTVAALGDDRDALERDAARAIAVAERHGLGFWRSYGQAFSILARLKGENGDAMTELMRACIASLDSIGMSPGYTIFTSSLVERLQGGGRLDEADRLIEELLVKTSLQHWGRPEFMRLKARVMRDREVRGHQGARAMLEDACELAERHGANAWRNRILTDLDHCSVAVSR